MGTTSEHREGGSVIRYDSAVIEVMEPGLFDVDWLRSKGCLVGQSRGRSQAYFLNYAGRQMVLRHFRRGGLIGRFNPDLYFRLGVERSRAMREFDLLGWMRAEGLPVPRPIAARHAPVGLFCRADIITERISEARPLEDVLRERQLSAVVWQAVGRVVRQMHDHGVYHSDLNCRNILLDDRKQVWLIDFDKCERRAPGDWAQGNLDRLQRSLRKESTRPTGLNWEEAAWSDLIEGYSGAKD
ncbi:MAG: 3-deoxy-D-manno-octulosonic acid kinase [Pseudomonadota bacterium]